MFIHIPVNSLPYAKVLRVYKNSCFSIFQVMAFSKVGFVLSIEAIKLQCFLMSSDASVSLIIRSMVQQRLR